ncbi:MAG: hypothetical protein ACPHQ9_03595 [Marinobacter sp.]|uniref:hypothetical protein n=1 Tax=Marinobacter sp. TaxID=50741 RepID=UPI003C382EDA
MQTLKEAYTLIREILGEHAEPLESVELVETYRRFFKPEKVRCVLLAESHVFTHDSERQIPILPVPGLPGYPEQYARFVYCLGYGEKHLTESENHPRRDGTPQFWKIFFSCCNPISSPDDFHPILGKTPAEQRVRNKIETLERMKRQGVWLVDASIVALYKDGKKIPGMFEALEASWRSYTRDIVISAQPEHVICIGKGVASVVESDLKKHFSSNYTVLAQPNAFLSSTEHFENYKTYSRICFGQQFSGTAE